MHSCRRDSPPLDDGAPDAGVPHSGDSDDRRAASRLWGLSDNGTAVGVKDPRMALLTTLAVLVSLGN